MRPLAHGATVALRTPVVRRATPGNPYSLEDGLGVRRIETDGRTNIEMLEVTPALAEQAAVEQAIRSSATRYADLETRLFAPVKGIERAGSSLRIVSEMPAGVRISHLLAHLESTGEVVPEAAIQELSSLVINAVASLHALPGGLAHGAISAAHVLLTNDGRIMLTDCVFGAGLAVLQRNREQLWKDFGLALPTAASFARFDQQADVTEMGALILGLALQRPLRAGEYPRGVSDLVVTATESASAPGVTGSTSALRMWLQEALQIHPRLAFRSAVEAQRAFADINPAPGSRRSSGAMALQVLLRTTCAEPQKQAPAVVNSPPQSAALPVHLPQKAPDERSRPLDSIPRAAFPTQGPN
jgi:hypothetical protein